MRREINLFFPADPAGQAFQVWGAVLPAKLACGGQHVEVGFVPFVLSFGFSLGKPPAVGGAQYPWIDAVRQVGNLDNPAVSRFDDNLVSLADAALLCRFRVDFKPRMGSQLSELFKPPV